MTISHDATTVAAAYASTGTQTTSHPGSAMARAVVVLIDQNGTATDEVSGVTYGGVAMARLDSNSEATEAGRTYGYFLSLPPQGTQNVAMTTTAATDKQLMVATMLSDNGIIRHWGTGSGSSASVANPSWTVSAGVGGSEASGSTGQKIEAYEVIHSGLTTMTNTPATSWTLISSTDLGAQGRGFARQTVASSASTLTCGWIAATADDYVGQAHVFYEDSNWFSPNNAGVETSIGNWESNTVFGGRQAATITRSTAKAHSGTASVLATFVANAGAYEWADCWAYGMYPNRRYLLTAWAWVPTGAPDVYLEALFQLAGATTSVKDAWTQLSFEWVNSAIDVACGVTSILPTAGQLTYVDDISLTMLPDLNAGSKGFLALL